jgi:hypothetical protein
MFRYDQDKYRCGCILGRRFDDAVLKAADDEGEEICTCNVQNETVTKNDEMKNDFAKCKFACKNVELSEEENLQLKQYLLDLSNYKSCLIFNTDAALSPSISQEEEDKIVTCCKMESKCLRLMAYIECYSGKAIDKEFLDELKKSRNTLNKDLSSFIPGEYRQWKDIKFEAMVRH